MIRSAAEGRGQRDEGIPVSAIAWVAAAAVFVGLRLGAAWTLPVFGIELDHLSGAWLASIGQDDSRYVPTLFQALTAGLLKLSASEEPARLVAVGAAATIPLAVFLLRRELGDIPAFLALVALALDPVGIALTSSANAAALDAPVAMWLFVAMRRGWISRAPVAGAVAFVVLLCGPLPLLVVIAFAVARRVDVSRLRVAPMAAVVWGPVAALLLASARFGLGFEELVVPPLDILAAGSERRWMTPAAGELAFLYDLPIVAGAGLAVVALALRVGPRQEPPLLAWLGFGAGWWLFSMGHENPLPMLGVTLPGAVVLARPLWRTFQELRYVEPRVTGAGLGIATFFVLVIWANVADWARLERAGDAGEATIVALFCLGALTGVGLLIWGRSTAALAVPVAFVGILMLMSGAFEVATGGAADPLISPFSPEGARELRDLAVASRDSTGMAIVVHPELEEDIAWPFRDSGVLIVSSRVPPTAGFVLWPADAPPPEGLVPLAGDWALTRTIRSPTADTLDFLHWLLDRNTLASRPETIAVYTRAGQ